MTTPNDTNDTPCEWGPHCPACFEERTNGQRCIYCEILLAENERLRAEKALIRSSVLENLDLGEKMGRAAVHYEAETARLRGERNSARRYMVIYAALFLVMTALCILWAAF